MKAIGSLASTIIALTLMTAASHRAQAATWQQMFSVSHGAQGTGNYKGKRDKHEKPGPMNEKKRKRPGWIFKR